MTEVEFLSEAGLLLFRRHMIDGSRSFATNGSGRGVAMKVPDCEIFGARECVRQKREDSSRSPSQLSTQNLRWM